MTAGARELLDAYARRELSPVEALPSGEDPHGAWAAWCLERARAEALAAEAAWRRGEPTGPLCGVPFAAKDLLDTTGVPTACGSALLAGRMAPRDAAAVARVREAGAILAGKTSTVEFAWGLMMRTARNPRDPARTPGGSSGGSAIALAVGDVPLALGTDTGGSIRLPAAFCGVVGFKPTYGAVPADGCWPLAPSMDCVGPMARTVADARLLLGVLTRAPVPRPPLAGLRAGVVAGRGVDAVAARLEAAGLRVGEVSVPSHEEVMAAYAPGFLAEALDVHRRAGLWPARRDGYGPAVRERLELAERQRADALAAGELAAARLREAYGALWSRIDVLVTPVCDTAPPRLDDERADLRETASPWLCAQNRLGLPAAALPCGAQITGPAAADAVVLAVAEAAEG